MLEVAANRNLILEVVAKLRRIFAGSRLIEVSVWKWWLNSAAFVLVFVWGWVRWGGRLIEVSIWRSGSSKSHFGGLANRSLMLDV